MKSWKYAKTHASRPASHRDPVLFAVYIAKTHKVMDGQIECRGISFVDIALATASTTSSESSNAAAQQALAKKGRDSDPGRRPGRKGRHPMAGHMAELGPHLRDNRRRCSNRARQAEARLKRLVKHGVLAALARNLQMVIVEGALPIIQKIRNLCIHVKNTLS